MFFTYFLPLIACLAVAYAGMFGYFQLFNDEPSENANVVVAIAAAPPSVACEFENEAFSEKPHFTIEIIQPKLLTHTQPQFMEKPP